MRLRLAAFATVVGVLVAPACGPASVSPELPPQRIAWNSCYEPAKGLECARESRFH